MFSIIRRYIFFYVCLCLCLYLYTMYHSPFSMLESIIKQFLNILFRIYIQISFNIDSSNNFHVYNVYSKHAFENRIQSKTPLFHRYQKFNTFTPLPVIKMCFHRNWNFKSVRHWHSIYLFHFYSFFFWLESFLLHTHIFHTLFRLRDTERLIRRVKHFT